jgi:hypothetical protein
MYNTVHVIYNDNVNIFWLDEDPKLAATYQHDKHVIKMVVETAQLLSTALRVLCGPDATSMLYRSTHRHHPCALWTASSRDNMLWLLHHGHALLDEYTYRYNKVHKTSTVMQAVTSLIDDVPVSAWTGKLTSPPQCMPDVHRTMNVVDAYRDYYFTCKLTPGNKSAMWTRRGTPFWIQQMVTANDSE